MDSSSQTITVEEKNKIADELADVMIAALENAEISEEESQNSSDYVLDNFEAITTREEMLKFLEELSNIWPIYKNVYLKQSGEIIKAEDQAKITDIQNNLDNMSNNQVN